MPRSVKGPLVSNEADVAIMLDVAAKDCRVLAVVAASSIYGDNPHPLGVNEVAAWIDSVVLVVI